jgi:transposase
MVGVSITEGTGVPRTVLATLLAEASDTLQRRDYHALRALCGSAPVTRRSGKSWMVVRRYACNRRLTNAAYHWALNAIKHDATSRAKYDALRAKGHGMPAPCALLLIGFSTSPAPC